MSRGYNISSGLITLLLSQHLLFNYINPKDKNV